MGSGEYERFADPEEYERVLEDRQIKAFVYHTRGYPYWKIARKMGHSQSYIKKLIDDFREANAHPGEADIRYMAVARYEAELVFLNKQKSHCHEPKDAAAISAQIRATQKEIVAVLGYAKPLKVELRNKLVTEHDEEIEKKLAVERARQLEEEAERDAKRNGAEVE